MTSAEQHHLFSGRYLSLVWFFDPESVQSEAETKAVLRPRPVLSTATPGPAARGLK